MPSEDPGPSAPPELDAPDRQPGPGPGVAPEDREQIFERFGRAAVAENDEGFGLGLSIVRAIAVAHGGSVEVADAPPRGARYVITLPARRVPSDATQVLEVPPWPAS